MKLRLAELVDAARDSTRRRRGLHSETGLRADAEAIGKRDGSGRLRAALDTPGVALIAEAKGASPLRGTLRPDYDPVALARGYRDSGAAAISVLTEEHFFAGSLDHLEAVSAAVELPVLRKDFISELYQLFEAAMAGAAGILLIAEVLEGAALAELVEAARTVGLDALVELHRPSLLAGAVRAGSGIVGINNRDLDTMEVDFEHALELAPQLPDGIVKVAESAISGPDDIVRIGRAGYGAALVGTCLVTAADPGAALRELVDAGMAVAGEER